MQVHENIRAALASLGLGFEDVIRTDNYITDRKYLPVLREVRARYFRPPRETRHHPHRPRRRRPGARGGPAPCGLSLPAARPA